jgi:hypothetical protein
MMRTRIFCRLKLAPFALEGVADAGVIDRRDCRGPFVRFPPFLPPFFFVAGSPMPPDAPP